LEKSWAFICPYHQPRDKPAKRPETVAVMAKIMRRCIESSSDNFGFEQTRTLAKIWKRLPLELVG